jgi:dolichol-phosphate mannosyltransferase
MTRADATPAERDSGARSLVIIPTYNERENLPIIVGKLFAACPEAHLLIVEDGSPDGTGEVADQMAAADPRIQVMHRSGKQGLGSAYLQGFARGLEQGYDYLIEMDADGSHPPETLPEMIAVAKSADLRNGGPALVIGSRWVPGGRVVNWPKRREILSRGANIYAAIALGVKTKDATAGYRVYNADALRALSLENVNSHGYCFQIDMTLRVDTAGYRIEEVPIVFREREIGESKMSGNIIFEAMGKVTLWGFQRRMRQLTGLFSRR